MSNHFERDTAIEKESKPAGICALIISHGIECEVIFLVAQAEEDFSGI